MVSQNTYGHGQVYR